MRSFLLQTSILEQLHGPLCDAVTGQAGGQAQLAALHRGNFFVVPLDDTRQWYRYHHLFADVLHAHVRAEQPELVSTLHQRASTWFEQHGASADAIRHALGAFPKTMNDEHGTMNESSVIHRSSFTVRPLVEPLSQRELDVLRLFNTELSGPEIARELVIGLSTVRTYTKCIES